MKNMFLITIIFLFISDLLFAQSEDNYVFNMEAGAGILYGMSSEFIFQSSFSHDYNSTLLWEIKPLPYISLSGDLGLKDPLARNSFFFNFDLKIGIPMKTGVMEDRDWMRPCETPQAVTHFSSHDNKTTAAVMFDSGVGLSMPLLGRFVSKISYNSLLYVFKYEAWDGYTQYGDNVFDKDYLPVNNDKFYAWDSSWPKIPFSGLGIDYLQIWINSRIVFGLEYHGSSFVIKSSFSLSTMNTGVTIDNHFAREPHMTLVNIVTGGIFFETKGSFIYKINDNFNIGLTVSYTIIDGARGDLIHVEEEIGVLNGGGAGFEAFACGIIARITL